MRHLTFLAVATTLAAFVPGAAWAQDVPAVAAPTFAAPSIEDVTLLKKAVDAVQKYPVALSSDLKVKASGSGVLVTINETIKVSGQFPGKFRADVTLLEEDGTTPAAKFQVSGDGKSVTTFRPGTKQYATQSVAAFQKDFALPTIGVVCGLIASADPWGMSESPVDSAGVTQFVDALKNIGLTLESGAGENGTRLFVLRQATPDASGFRVQMQISPQTSGFVAMEMSGKQGDWKFAVTETVRSMAKLGSFTPTAFTPPTDATKVAKLSVWPF